jgi:hypothetical protein
MQTKHLNVLEELRSYKIGDVLLEELLKIVWEIVSASEIVADFEFELLIGNSTSASQILLQSRYATTNCKALLAERLVIADEPFLIEVESAVRAFEIAGPIEACPYLRSDEDLFRLVDSIGADPYKAVMRMRRMTSRAKDKEMAIRHTVALTYLFFIGHELGHLLNGDEAGSFTRFVDADSPLEHRLANAVVKLRRHAEEFETFKFNLPGFEHTLLEGSEIEQSSAALQKLINRLYINHTRFFEEEVNADKIGTNILLEHLAEALDDEVANTRMYRIVRGVFAVALYSWYRDLRIFYRKIGTTKLSNTRGLTVAMMRNRESYIHAASLFGEVHRFTLLRAEQLLEEMINARSNAFCQNGEKPRLFGRDDPVKLREVVARYRLLCFMMDTAIKISYVGASTAWLMKTDQKRGGPQLFQMNFEPVDVSMQRLMAKFG